MKRIKRYFLPILLIALSFLLIVNIPVKADSGFDFDYDSGSSWDSDSSWDSGSSFDFDWDFGNNDSSGFYFISSDNTINFFVIVEYIIALFLMIPYFANASKKNRKIGGSLLAIVSVILITLMFVMSDFFSYFLLAIFFVIDVFLTIKVSSFSSKTKGNNSNLLDINSLGLEDIKNILGEDFNYEEFKKLVFDNYKEIQIAWMDNNIESVRNLLSDTLFNSYKTQLLTLSTKNQKNMMEDINYIDCYISKINKSSDTLNIEVLLIVTCRDYIIDITNNKVLRGDKNKINKCYYKLTFTTLAKDMDYKYCPNCGAELASGSSVKCDYCGSIIVKKSNDYILTDKKMLKQE